MICAHIRRYYPDVVFISDSSGLRVTQGLRMQMKRLRSSRGIPDLIVLCPVGEYHGLMLEIKTDDTPLFRRDGELIADPHIHEQHGMIIRLRHLGFAAFFVRGIDAAISCFENYIRNTVHFNARKRSDVEWMDNTIPGSMFLNHIKPAKF